VGLEMHFGGHDHTNLDARNRARFDIYFEAVDGRRAG